VEFTLFPVNLWDTGQARLMLALKAGLLFFHPENLSYEMLNIISLREILYLID
jgi:hypothetical protein